MVAGLQPGEHLVEPIHQFADLVGVGFHGAYGEVVAHADGLGGAREAQDGRGNNALQGGGNEEAQAGGDQGGEAEVHQRAGELVAQFAHVAHEVERADGAALAGDRGGQKQFIPHEPSAGGRGGRGDEVDEGGRRVTGDELALAVVGGGHEQVGIAVQMIEGLLHRAWVAAEI